MQWTRGLCRQSLPNEVGLLIEAILKIPQRGQNFFQLCFNLRETLWRISVGYGERI
jgi:hypothetical protein